MSYLDNELQVNKNISCCCDYLRGSFDYGCCYKTFLDFLNDLNSSLNFTFFLDHFYVQECRNMFGRYTSYANFGNDNTIRFYWYSEIPCSLDFNVNTRGETRLLFEFSGDGIRKLKQLKVWDSLLRFLYSKNPDLTRLDVAIDFFQRDNAFVPLLQDAFRNELHSQMGFGDACLQSRMNLSKLRSFTHKDDFRTWNLFSVNYECLNPASELGGFRLYDKWLEIKTVPRFKNIADLLLKNVPDEYWYRLEYESVNSTSTALFNLWLDPSNSNGFLSCVEFCLTTFFSVKEYKSSGYRRCQLDNYLVWVDLLSFFSSISSTELNSYLTKQPYVTCIDSTRRRLAQNSTSTTRDLFSLFIDEEIFSSVITKQKYFGSDKHFNLVLEYAETKDILLPDPSVLRARIMNFYDFLCSNIYRHIT